MMTAYGQEIIVIKEELEDEGVVQEIHYATAPQSLARPGSQDSSKNIGKYTVKTSDTDECRKPLHRSRADTEESHLSSKEGGESSQCNPGNLLRKAIINAGEKPHGCQECGKSFSDSSTLRNHHRVHTGDKPHVCDKCGMSFTRFYTLRIHHRVHTGEKPHVCNKCGKCFSRSSTLHIHHRVHTGEKPCVCKQCGKSFSDPSCLHRHSLVHTGEKPHVCDKCGKCFSQYSNLQTHRRVHTGEKPHACRQCEKYFSEPSSLHRHSRVHIGEKPYVSNECGNYFTRSRILRTHRRVHTGEKLMDDFSVADSTRDGVSQNKQFLIGTRVALKLEPPDDTLDALEIFKPSTSFRHESDIP